MRLSSSAWTARNSSSERRLSIEQEPASSKHLLQLAALPVSCLPHFALSITASVLRASITCAAFADSHLSLTEALHVFLIVCSPGGNTGSQAPWLPMDGGETAAKLAGVRPPFFSLPFLFLFQRFHLRCWASCTACGEGHMSKACADDCQITQGSNQLMQAHVVPATAWLSMFHCIWKESFVFVVQLLVSSLCWNSSRNLQELPSAA